MQNLDPVYFVTPVAVIALMVGVALYWRARRSFRGRVLLFSLAAYAGAIALKYAVQVPTITAFQSATGGNLFLLGLYYGVQTAVFEVGGAYAVARYAVSRGGLGARDSEGFGIGLAFWENAVLFSIPLLLDYTVYYALLSNPSSSSAQTLYQILVKDAPSLFYPPQAALTLVGYAVLERVSSFFAHFAWGVLCVLSVVYRKRAYLAAALPIGFLIDFLVPFSGTIGVGAFEGSIFIIGSSALAVVLLKTGAERSSDPEPAPVQVAGSNT